MAQEIVEALRGAGCSLIGPVASLSSALEAVQGEVLDAAVLDVNLGGSLVWPVGVELHSRGVPFVFATGYSGIVQPPGELERMPWVEIPVRPPRLLSILAGAVESAAESSTEPGAAS